MSGPLERLGEPFAEVKEVQTVFFLLCQEGEVWMVSI